MRCSARGRRRVRRRSGRRSACGHRRSPASSRIRRVASKPSITGHVAVHEDQVVVRVRRRVAARRRHRRRHRRCSRSSPAWRRRPSGSPRRPRRAGCAPAEQCRPSAWSGAGASGGAATALFRRSSSQKVEPSSIRLSTPTRPPISSASSLTIARPRPLPPWRRVLEASTWVKASNTESNWSGAMPMPVSRTSKRSRTACRRRPASTIDLERDAAALGELDRVVEQVDEHLAQAHRVALDKLGQLGARSCS